MVVCGGLYALLLIKYTSFSGTAIGDEVRKLRKDTQSLAGKWITTATGGGREGVF
jgi:hypothetical protein